MSSQAQPGDATRSRPRRWAMTFVAFAAGAVAVLLTPLVLLVWGFILSLVAVGFSLTATAVALFRREDHPGILMATLLFCAVPIGLFVTLLGPFILWFLLE